MDTYLKHRVLGWQLLMADNYGDIKQRQDLRRENKHDGLVVSFYAIRRGMTPEVVSIACDVTQEVVLIVDGTPNEMTPAVLGLRDKANAAMQYGNFVLAWLCYCDLLSGRYNHDWPEAGNPFIQSSNMTETK